MKDTFGNHINELRGRLNLTVRQLAARAGVPETLICGLQGGSRVVGENNARKIGAALELAGDKLESFVYRALNDATEKILETSQAYPSEILNLVACELRSIGICPETITQCVRKPMFSDTADAALYLEDGRTAVVDVRLSFR